MTFSIVATDGVDVGVAVSSKFVAVGAFVPHVEASVGAVATQCYANPRLGKLILALMRQGVHAREAVERAVAQDSERELRQIDAPFLLSRRPGGHGAPRRRLAPRGGAARRVDAAPLAERIGHSVASRSPRGRRGGHLQAHGCRYTPPIYELTIGVRQAAPNSPLLIPTLFLEPISASSSFNCHGILLILNLSVTPCRYVGYFS
ncbi:MAG: DUF1028 domain-containing protein [Pyrobaculum sp.]